MRPIQLCLAAIVTGLVLASPASAAYVTSVQSMTGYCQITERTVLDARPGETNTVTIRGTEHVSVPFPGSADPCFRGLYVVWAETVVVDVTATLQPGGRCRYAVDMQNRVATCMSGHDAFAAILRDRNDTLVAETMPGFVDAGPGNDHVELLLGGRVVCRDGHDTVIAGPSVRVEADCEQVVRVN